MTRNSDNSLLMMTFFFDEKFFFAARESQPTERSDLFCFLEEYFPRKTTMKRVQNESIVARKQRLAGIFTEYQPVGLLCYGIHFGQNQLHKKQYVSQIQNQNATKTGVYLVHVLQKVMSS
jgi:hypothetical protein